MNYNNYAYPHAGTNALSENRDGILIESYSIQPEKWGTTNQLVNSLLGIPIVTDQLVIKKILGHEFGHLMGVRDLYDVTSVIHRIRGMVYYGKRRILFCIL